MEPRTDYYKRKIAEAYKNCNNKQIDAQYFIIVNTFVDHWKVI